VKEEKSITQYQGFVQNKFALLSEVYPRRDVVENCYKNSVSFAHSFLNKIYISRRKPVHRSPSEIGEGGRQEYPRVFSNQKEFSCPAGDGSTLLRNVSGKAEFPIFSYFVDNKTKTIFSKTHAFK